MSTQRDIDLYNPQFLTGLALSTYQEKRGWGQQSHWNVDSQKNIKIVDTIHLYISTHKTILDRT